MRRNPIRHGYLIGLIYFGGTFWWISNVTAIGTFLLDPLPGALSRPSGFCSWRGLLGRGQARLVRRSCSRRSRAAALVGRCSNGGGAGSSPASTGTNSAFRRRRASSFANWPRYGGVHLISFVLVAVNILWAEGVARHAEDAAGKAGRPRIAAICGGAFHRRGLFRARLASSAAASRRDAAARPQLRLHPARTSRRFPTTRRATGAISRTREDAALDQDSEAFHARRSRTSPISSSGPKR